MSETELIANWVAERRSRASGGEAATGCNVTLPAPDAEFGDDVMVCVRQAAAVPSFAERIAVAARKLMPARRHRLVYLGGGAFAGALRVIVILYLVLGVS